MAAGQGATRRLAMSQKGRAMSTEMSAPRTCEPVMGPKTREASLSGTAISGGRSRP